MFGRSVLGLASAAASPAAVRLAATSEERGDATVENALVEAAGRGVDVSDHFVMSAIAGTFASDFWNGQRCPWPDLPDTPPSGRLCS